MASHFYPEFGDLLAAGSFIVGTHEVRIVLVTSTYTYSASHATLADVAAGARKGDIVALSGDAVAASVFTWNDVTVTNVPGSETLTGYILMKYNSGTPENSDLILYIDKSGDTLATDGNDVLVDLSSVTHTLIP